MPSQLPYRCIDCGKSIHIMYGAICEKCKKKRDEKRGFIEYRDTGDEHYEVKK
tara:strand:+ start:4767 stop:4925 length:159 start_codon:yes stop_codon:yes gene_type:complete